MEGTQAVKVGERFIKFYMLFQKLHYLYNLLASHGNVLIINYHNTYIYIAAV